jgi:hypothetical protein
MVAEDEHVACNVNVVPTVAPAAGYTSVTEGPATTVITSVAAVFAPVLSQALMTTLCPPGLGLIEVFNCPLVSVFLNTWPLSTYISHPVMPFGELADAITGTGAVYD